MVVALAVTFAQFYHGRDAEYRLEGRLVVLVVRLTHRPAGRVDTKDKAPNQPDHAIYPHIVAVPSTHLN